MKFGEKVRKLRKTRGLTQVEMAQVLGISLRTLQYYETGKLYPRKRDSIMKLADYFGVKASDLISAEDMYSLEGVEDAIGAKRDVELLISEITSLFAGGSLSDSDKEYVMAALNHAYWESKSYNKRYAPKRLFRDDDDEE